MGKGKSKPLNKLLVPLAIGAATGAVVWLLEQKHKSSMPKFDKKITPPYQTLIRCAAYAKLAYYDPEAFKQQIPESCCEESQKFLKIPDDIKFYDASTTNHAEDTQAYTWVCEDEKTLYIVFRGTSSGKDIMADLQISTLPWGEPADGVRVHRGFYEQFLAIEHEMDADVKAFVEAGVQRIVCTGHSLGAALSTIAAVYFAEKYVHVPVCCYTFGSPRVGNRKFTDIFHKEVDVHWRAFNRSDPVSMIPLTRNFHHVMGNGICCDAGPSRLVRHYDSGNILTRLVRGLMKMNYLAVAGAHKMSLYVEKLEWNAYNVQQPKAAIVEEVAKDSSAK